MTTEDKAGCFVRVQVSARLWGDDAVARGPVQVAVSRGITAFLLSIAGGRDQPPPTGRLSISRTGPSQAAAKSRAGGAARSSGRRVSAVRSSR